MSDVSYLVLVARLKECYWPRWVHEWTIERVRAAGTRPIHCGYREERDEQWDIGRVHHFVQVLERGDAIDPVSIESHVYGNGMAPPSWGPPFVYDGHHRFAAAVLTKQETIAASFGGLVTTLNWLVGRRKNPPPEVLG